MNDPGWMREAIAAARDAIAAGQSPYGACVVRDGRLIARAHNSVCRDHDPSAHAEINAMRAAGRALGTYDLAGCTVYTTCEPCLMCFTCCHWAHVARIVYGTSVADSAALGFGELPYDASQLLQTSARPMSVTGGILRDECLDLFRIWQTSGVPERY